MISKIQYPKLTGLLQIGGGVVLLAGVLAVWTCGWYSMPISTLVLALASIYVVIGPLYAKTIKGE
jgi:hypothetical protein